MTEAYENYRQNSLQAKVENCIYRALLEEVYTTPKPGLVDRRDNGAHQDMDCTTFEVSAAAIAPYLGQMFQEGLFWRETPQALFKKVRKTGLLAEKAMFRATGGINTHKGLIFTIGILSSAAGYYYGIYGKMNVSEILRLSGQMTAEVLEKEFEEIRNRRPVTHGEILYRIYGEKGIRGEAQQGFPILAGHIYPLLRFYRKGQTDKNEANINVLLKSMMMLNDTNVLSRADQKSLAWLKKEAESIWNAGGAFTIPGFRKIEELNRKCIERNISPGGSADLLAAAVFLWNMEELFMGNDR